MSGPSNNSEIQIKSGPQSPEISPIKLLSAMRSVLCQPAVPLEAPKVDSPYKHCLPPQFGRACFQTTPIKRTSTVKGGLNNKVFIIIRYLSSHKPEQHEANNYLGWVTWRLEKCYKYHMRVKPTMSMK